jgi:hypothetical protein
MHFLLISAQSSYVNNNELNKISTLSSIYSYFFKKYLQDYGHKITCIDIPIDEKSIIPEADYCISLYNRGIKMLKPVIYDVLRSKIKKEIITICITSKIIDKEDLLLFYVGKRKNKTLKIHWMAEPTLLFPEKKSDRISILVDHIYYGDKQSRIYIEDKTRFTIQTLLEFRKEYKIKPIDIYHISSNGVKLINSMDDVEEYKQGCSINYLDMIKYYNLCDIFVNTHYEAMGLSNLECAMSGALILTFNDFLKHEFSSLIHHYKVTNDNIDWTDIISKIDVDKSIKMVQKYTYEDSVKKLIEYLDI